MQDKKLQNVEVIFDYLMSLWNIKTYRELAVKLDVKEGTLNAWKARGRIAKPNLILAKCSRISPEYLLTGREPMLVEEQQEEFYSLVPEEEILQSNEDALPMVRHYRELAAMDADTFGEIQTWINDMEKLRPGYTGWFRQEFQNRFPEFEKWKMKQQKKSGGAGHQNGSMEVKSSNGQ